MTQKTRNARPSDSLPRRLSCTVRKTNFAGWHNRCNRRVHILNHNVTPENTHLLCKGKYHCTTDLLFDWFGFSWTTGLHVCQIQTSQTGGQPYSETFLYEESECSLITRYDTGNVFKWNIISWSMPDNWVSQVVLSFNKPIRTIQIIFPIRNRRLTETWFGPFSNTLISERILPWGL